MRTIKFRGKVKHHDPMTNPENGWVEGYYFQDLALGEMRSYIFLPPCSWEVFPETVGQFTGLLDKNGKEIYEGDIIIEKLRRARKDGERLVICFDDFEWQGKNANGATTSLSLLFEYHTVEVIGNIHDHPELMKGGTE
jgi:uncharacterized phage protein (TIGR01671 family)